MEGKAVFLICKIKADYVRGDGCNLSNFVLKYLVRYGIWDTISNEEKYEKKDDLMEKGLTGPGNTRSVVG